MIEFCISENIWKTLEELNNNKISLIFSIIGNCCFAITTILFLIRKSREYIFTRRPNVIRESLIVGLLVFCGFVSPILLLNKAFLDWEGVKFFLALFLAIYVLLSFIGLCYMILVTFKILREGRKKGRYKKKD